MMKEKSCTQSAGAAVQWLAGEQEMGVEHSVPRTERNGTVWISALRSELYTFMPYYSLLLEFSICNIQRGTETTESSPVDKVGTLMIAKM